MIDAKKLIEENNRKRELLTEENEKYYSNLMLYIRVQLTLSEQQSEEVLMEMLDHLLEGQAEGKTARQIFGADPKAYADEIIQQLPKEDKRAVIPFILSIILNLLSWILIFRGAAVLIISQFKSVDMTEYPFKLLIIAALITVIVFGAVMYIFGLIRNSLFTDNSEKKNMVKAGLYGALAFMLIFVAVKFIPSFGPSFELTWWASAFIGAGLWLIAFIVKKKFV